MSRSKETGFKHSDAYHAYFEGYSEKVGSGKDGRGGKIERVYIADYYKHDLTDAQHALLKTGYCLLFLFSVACFLLPQLLVNVISLSPVAAAAQFLTIIVLVLNAVFLIIYVTAPRKLTIGDYHQTTTRLKRFMLIGTGIYLILFMVYLVFFIIYIFKGMISFADVIVLIACLAGAAALFSIWMIERKLNYITIDNPNVKEEGSIEIWN